MGSLIAILLICNLNDLYSQQQIQGNTKKMLITKALEKNYVYKNQTLEIKKDKLEKYKIYQTYIPNVSLNTTFTRLNDDIVFNIPPITLDPIRISPTMPAIVLPPKQLPPLTLQNKDIWKIDVSANMVLFSGLKAPMMLKAITHKQKADEAMLVKNEASIIKEVSEFYDKLAVIEESIKLLNESKLRLEQETKFANKAFTEGLITSFDLSKIEIAQNDLEAKQIELKSNRKLVISKLYELTGIDKTVLDTIKPVLEPYISMQISNSVDNRPEVIALKEVIIANKYKNKAAYTSYIPVVYGFYKKELRTDDLSALEPEWYVGVGAKWNIFDGFQNVREIQKSKIDIEIAKNNYENSISMMNLNLEKSVNELELSNQLIVVAAKKRNTAKKNLEIMVKQYEQGLSSITERIIAEIDLQNAELEYCQAIYRQRQAQLNLQEASGTLTIENIN